MQHLVALGGVGVIGRCGIGLDLGNWPLFRGRLSCLGGFGSRTGHLWGGQFLKFCLHLVEAALVLDDDLVILVHQVEAGQGGQVVQLAVLDVAALVPAVDHHLGIFGLLPQLLVVIGVDAKHDELLVFHHLVDELVVGQALLDGFARLAVGVVEIDEDIVGLQFLEVFDILAVGGDVIKVGGNGPDHVLLGTLEQQTLLLFLGTAEDVILGSMLQYDHIQSLIVYGIGGIAETALGKFHHLAVSLGVLGECFHSRVHQEFCLSLFELGSLFQ